MSFKSFNENDSDKQYLLPLADGQDVEKVVIVLVNQKSNFMNTFPEFGNIIGFSILCDQFFA